MNSDLKNSECMLQSGTKKLEVRLKKLEGCKKQKRTVSSQTRSSIDVPYAVTDTLPPIFGSKLCVRSKPLFMSNSLPNLSTVVMVEVTEDDLLLEAAEEALAQQYDLEVSSFYNEARKKKLTLHQVPNQT